MKFIYTSTCRYINLYLYKHFLVSLSYYTISDIWINILTNFLIIFFLSNYIEETVPQIEKFYLGIAIIMRISFTVGKHTFIQDRKLISNALLFLAVTMFANKLCLPWQQNTEKKKYHLQISAILSKQLLVPLKGSQEFKT